jgi:LPS export ABC transporter protein LptC
MTGVRQIVFAVITVAIALVSIVGVYNASKMIAVQESVKNDQDFFMVDAIYTKFNDVGEVSSKIYAEKITHMVEKDIFYFEAPKIVINSKEEQPWRINSRKAKSERGKEKISLWGGVTINRKGDEQHPNLQISTNSMQYYPQQKIANTDDVVKILENNNTIEAVGATIDFKTAIIKLLSKVRAIYKLT